MLFYGLPCLWYLNLLKFIFFLLVLFSLLFLILLYFLFGLFFLNLFDLFFYIIGLCVLLSSHQIATVHNRYSQMIQQYFYLYVLFCKGLVLQILELLFKTIKLNLGLELRDFFINKNDKVLLKIIKLNGLLCSVIGLEREEYLDVFNDLVLSLALNLILKLIIWSVNQLNFFDL